jgi:hypothetical protein
MEQHVCMDLFLWAITFNNPIQNIGLVQCRYHHFIEIYPVACSHHDIARKCSFGVKQQSSAHSLNHLQLKLEEIKE